ncbi:MAG: DUF6457 domain-containing protein [Actinomycetota bacterium]
MSWLQRVTDRVASACKIDAPPLALPPEDARDVLEIARIASHTSGERINAPLLCYVLGVAAGRGASFRQIVVAAKEAAEAEGAAGD